MYMSYAHDWYMQRPEEIIQPEELELQEVVSYLTWVLGTETWSFPATVLNH